LAFVGSPGIPGAAGALGGTQDHRHAGGFGKAQVDGFQVSPVGWLKTTDANGKIEHGDDLRE
jgi:hypothetical protein